MKIGIFGGSFNPVHNGHVSVVKYVIENINLDKIIIVPVGIPSHRENDLENKDERLHMCKLAFEHMDNVDISDIEVKAEKISYTYDTLLEIQKIYGEYNEYYEIIGEDSYAYFDKWRNYKEILELSKVVVLQRDGYEGDIISDNIIMLDSPFFPYSSTEIRKRLENDDKIDNMVPKDVLDYINQKSLYKRIKVRDGESW
ncbi:nicotinate (nicotinamide) nucleotide adenylyltransferase [Fusobacterium sp. PH5-44]|uniref:nicotinate (nicotinamide) nucleotide adenylyltransferase n=1 Tax=unclassified Fusobacterium TaxID=2648384 RepID=UPI003D19BD67